jgi:biotin-dependent carboxylase-like uncharacterized protein
VIEVIDPGGLTTVQDLGRPGWAHLGVPPSGAVDRAALRLANRLVGNDEGAAALETTLRGPALRFDRPAVVALAGAPVPARAGERELAMHATEAVAAGEVVRLGTARTGLRTYLAVRGGIAAEPVLGSAATDLLTGLGPDPLAAGARLRLADRARAWPAATVAPVPALAPDPVLGVVAGPRDDWFAPAALDVLRTARWAVAPVSNRVGVRLTGPRLERVRDDELASEGVLAGALQVPPSGTPILLLADHPTTGGYPVIAVVVTADLPRAGQLRPGDEVRFALHRGAG